MAPKSPRIRFPSHAMPCMTSPFCTEHHHANPDLGGPVQKAVIRWMDGWQGCLYGVTLASLAFFSFFFFSQYWRTLPLIRQIRDTHSNACYGYFAMHCKVVLLCTCSASSSQDFLVNGITHSMKQYQYTCFTRICQNPKLVIPTLGEERGRNTISCFFLGGGGIRVLSEM